MNLKESITLWVPVLGLLATGALWFNTNRQIGVMESQLQFSKDQLAVNQRAWVGLKELRKFVLEPGKQIQANVVFYNSGKSIALKASSSVSMVRDQNNVSLDEIILAAKAESLKLQHSNMSLFPDTETFVQVSTRDALDQTQVRLIREKKTLLYIVGSFSYQDVFKNSHATSICLRYSPPDNGFNHCDKYNEAD